MKTRNKVVNLHLSHEEKLAFEQASELAGTTLSGWMRTTLRSAAIEKHRWAGYPLPFVRKDRLDEKAPNLQVVENQ